VTDREFASWPAGAAFPAEECVTTACAACGLGWRAHRSMVGFRLRCRCGAWVAVPVPEDVRALPGSTAALAQAAAASLSARDDDEQAFLAAAPRPRELAGVRGWDGRPLRPDSDGTWSMRHADVDARKKWNNRTVLSLAAILGCFWIPAIVIQLCVDGPHSTLYLPMFSVASSLLVLVVAHAGREYAISGLRGAHARYFLESTLVAGATAALAIGFSRLLEREFPEMTSEIPALRAELGMPLLLLVFSFCPGVFEELAFRGVLQGRLYPLMGRIQAILVCGAAFGAAHGLQAGLPFQMGIGFYLAFLRDRSGSLLPGMLAHMLYNASIVVALAA
jgi:membrane protease YdiL (CAAX protease family)